MGIKEMIADHRRSCSIKNIHRTKWRKCMPICSTLDFLLKCSNFPSLLHNPIRNMVRSLMTGLNSSFYFAECKDLVNNNY